jgi:hypothetical protein
MVLAMGTAAMTTGMGDISLLPAFMVCALGEHMRAMFHPAHFHDIQGFYLGGADRI